MSRGRGPSNPIFGKVIHWNTVLRWIIFQKCRFERPAGVARATTELVESLGAARPRPIGAEAANSRRERLLERPEYRAGVMGNHVQEGKRGTRGPSIAAFPMTKRRDGKPETRGKRVLRHAHAPPQRSHVDVARLGDQRTPPQSNRRPIHFPTNGHRLPTVYTRGVSPSNSRINVDSRV